MSNNRTFATFREAANFARSYAVRIGESVSVIRSGSGWRVFPSDIATQLLIEELENDRADLAEFEDESREDQRLAEYDREFGDILAEGDEANESFARSEETGWYYPD